MKKVFAITATLALLCLGIAAQADVFNEGPGLVNLDTVTVEIRGTQLTPPAMAP